MNEDIKEIEKIMGNIDTYVNELNKKGRISDDDIISLSIEVKNLDLMLDKVLKPMNYERRIKILD
ncbi:MAG: hypothetical protein IJ593_00010 [Lachnospiraceae bacterium]|nr:hypothetical protein [Lachnospiraceae bacterium]